MWAARSSRNRCPWQHLTSAKSYPQPAANFAAATYSWARSSDSALVNTGPSSVLPSRASMMGVAEGDAGAGPVVWLGRGVSPRMGQLQTRDRIVGGPVPLTMRLFERGEVCCQGLFIRPAVVELIGVGAPIATDCFRLPAPDQLSPREAKVVQGRRTRSVGFPCGLPSLPSMGWVVKRLPTLRP